jgi:hypothetical protein
VPYAVVTAAERLARELGTTSNDAIVRLAEEGAGTDLVVGIVVGDLVEILPLDRPSAIVAGRLRAV